MNNPKHIIIIGFVILILFLSSLAAILFRRSDSVPENPFLRYTDYTIGERLPNITHCDQYDFSNHGEGVFAFCPINDGVIRRAVIASDYQHILYGYLYTDNLTLGDLVQWYGYPTNTAKAHSWWLFRWNNLVAYTQHGMNRFDTKIQMVSLLKVSQ